MIYYVSPYNLRRPRRTTNRISDVRFCRSLVCAGATVTLLAPYMYRRDNVSAARLHAHWGITEDIEIRTLRTPMWDEPPRAIRVPVSLAGMVAAYLAEAARLGSRLRGSTWISRDHNAVLAILTANRLLGQTRRATVVYWAHELLPEHRSIRRIYQSVDGVLATNSAIAEDLRQEFGLPADRVGVTLHALNPELMEEPAARPSLRTELGIKSGAPLVVYTGKLGRALVEMDFIVKAAAMLPHCQFVITGGTADHVRHWSARTKESGVKNTMFTGYLEDPGQVRELQAAADVLVSYYTSENKLLDYNFPQKIVEYMLSGSPIVTVESRATQDVLDAESAFFVEPHSAAALAAGIREVLDNEQEARGRAERARATARSLTLENRGRAVVSFLNQLGAMRGAVSVPDYQSNSSPSSSQSRSL